MAGFFARVPEEPRQEGIASGETTGVSFTAGFPILPWRHSLRDLSGEAHRAKREADDTVVNSIRELPTGS